MRNTSSAFQYKTPKISGVRKHEALEPDKSPMVTPFKIVERNDALDALEYMTSTAPSHYSSVHVDTSYPWTSTSTSTSTLGDDILKRNLSGSAQNILEGTQTLEHRLHILQHKFDNVVNRVCHVTHMLSELFFQIAELDASGEQDINMFKYRDKRNQLEVIAMELMNMLGTPNGLANPLALFQLEEMKKKVVGILNQ